MKIVIREWNRQSPPDAPGDFGSEPLFRSLARRSRLFPYVLSASLHAICIWGPIIGTAGQPREKPQEAVYASKALMIRLTRPEPVPEVKRTRRSKRARNPARDLRTRASEIISALNSLKEKKAPAVNKPAVPAGNQAAGSQTEAILIQPQYPLEMRPPPAAEAVPSILLWSGQPQRMPPKAAPPPLPGVRQIPAPVLEPPVLNSDANRPNFVLSELGPPSPNLWNPAMTAPPIQDQDRPQPSRPGAAPESIKLLSISDAPATRDIIIVPPGNLIPSAMPAVPAETKQAGAAGAPGLPAEAAAKQILPTAPPAKATPPAVRTAAAEAKANGKDISPVLRISEVPKILAAAAIERNNPIPPPAPKPDSTVDQAAPKAALRRTETSVPAGPPRATGTPAGRASPVPEVKSGNAAPAPAPRPNAVAIIESAPAPALTGRLEHPPNGRHDVIIVQSALDDETPGISGLLTGKPIHTDI